MNRTYIPGWNRAFASVLRELRLRKGLTQAEMADKCGINRSHFGKLELGRTLPRLDTLIKIAMCLDMKYSELARQIEYRHQHPRRILPE